MRTRGLSLRGVPFAMRLQFIAAILMFGARRLLRKACPEELRERLAMTAIKTYAVVHYTARYFPTSKFKRSRVVCGIIAGFVTIAF